MKRMIRKLVHLAGFEIRRRAGEGDAGTHQSYYQPPSSCQIRWLGHLYELFLGRRSCGFFVEIGAYDGVSFSNSSCLADRGWSGLLVEPVPEFAEMSRQRYAQNQYVSVVECAVGSESGTVSLTVAGALTTGNRQVETAYGGLGWAKNHLSERHITADQVTLDQLLGDHADGRTIDVLIVDVEGFEGEVFAGFSLDRWRPTMLIAELTDTHPDLDVTRSQDARLIRDIIATGYSIVYKDAINTVFVLEDWAQLCLGLSGGDSAERPG